MVKASDNPFPSILIDESAEPSAPAAGHQRLYMDSTSFRLSATNSSGTQRELEYAGIATFTPTWTGSGSNPSLGDGTLTGHWQKIADKLHWFTIYLAYGSTSSAGTGFYSFGNLPFTVKSTSPAEQVVAAQIRDSGTARFTATGILSAGATTVGQIIVGDATGARQFSGTVPITLATGDTCIVEGIVATD